MDTSVPSAKVEISHVEPPPIDGSLSSLLEFADYQATHHGELPWLIYPAQPSSNNLAAVSFAEMVSASHRIAHAIRPRQEGAEGRVMAVILHTDAVVYVAVLLGVLRAGFVVRTPLKRPSTRANSRGSRIRYRRATRPKA